ncbi:hypothetical protein NY78_1869 [Desulfovibrio sp. TomC]|nr:hypothetical protein NY78_1869 [Desulfovibrio sp. TomC]
MLLGQQPPESDLKKPGDTAGILFTAGRRPRSTWEMCRRGMPVASVLPGLP